MITSAASATNAIQIFPTPPSSPPHRSFNHMSPTRHTTAPTTHPHLPHCHTDIRNRQTKKRTGTLAQRCNTRFRRSRTTDGRAIAPKHAPRQADQSSTPSKAHAMLTISRLGHRSIKYYNDTANHANTGSQASIAGGGLAEYYSEGETRIPSWLVVGDKNAIANATGLNGSALDGGDADTEIARDLARRRPSPQRRHRTRASPKRACTVSISPSPRPKASR